MDGVWRLAEKSRMDCVSVLAPDGELRIVEFRNLVQGDSVVLGRTDDGSEGILMHTEGFSAGGKSAELAGDVALTGAVVSEYPPGARQHGSFFRARNRISAGLSVAAVVVEAPAKSGALLFANEAMSQGREIFAVPGNADSPNSVGTNDLLMDGAIPATGGWDILCGFERRYPGLADPGGTRRRMPEEREVECLRQENVSRPAEPQPEPEAPEPYEPPDISELLKDLDETQLALVRAIDGPSVHIDKIAERSGLPMNTVLKELTMLQLMGVVTMVSYKCFALAAPG